MAVNELRGCLQVDWVDEVMVFRVPPLGDRRAYMDDAKMGALQGAYGTFRHACTAVKDFGGSLRRSLGPTGSSVLFSSTTFSTPGTDDPEEPAAVVRVCTTASPSK